MRISPRQLAVAIGVSESSLKRWADAGKLVVSRTEGGHRRIAMTEAVRFIRDSGATVVRPDVLGFGAGGGAAKRGRGPERPFVAALLAGDARTARTSLVGRFVAGESIAALADGDIAQALARIDELRERGVRDARSELAARFATDALAHAIAALRGVCEVSADSPLAIGGARAAADEARAAGGGARATGDGERATGGGEREMALRSAVVAAVLAAEGFRAIDLGADVGAAVLRAAAAAHRPAVTWIVDAEGVEIGGDAKDRYPARKMAEVAAFARGLKSRA